MRKYAQLSILFFFAALLSAGSLSAQQIADIDTSRALLLIDMLENKQSVSSGDIIALQKFLKDRGHFPTGTRFFPNYGPKTQAAAKKFREAVHRAEALAEQQRAAQLRRERQLAEQQRQELLQPIENQGRSGSQQEPYLTFLTSARNSEQHAKLVKMRTGHDSPQIYIDEHKAEQLKMYRPALGDAIIAYSLAPTHMKVSLLGYVRHLESSIRSLGGALAPFQSDAPQTETTTEGGK